jgi:hypothetical protein
VTRDQIVIYLDAKAGFRRETAESCRPGTQGVVKNQLYAYALERVIEHVRNLPDDAPAFQRLKDVDVGSLDQSETDIHTHTIHCSLGKPPKIEEWFANWVNMVALSMEGGAE